MKVLIAEDDHPSNLLLKNLLLRWGFDIVTAFNGTEAWRILQEDETAQIAILDWMMPGMDGLEVCRRLREKEKGGDRYVYVVVLTARGDKEDIVTGIDAGADDYIVKPFDREELRARLRTGQRVVELQTALRVANKKLLILSRLDPLTGALSRTALLNELDLAIYRASREQQKPLSIFLVDIDNLKEINGVYGRGAGEKILQDTVRRISTCLRKTDFVGRSGGDEFLAIMPGVGTATGMAICQRVRNVIGEKPYRFNDQSIPATASMCLALWDGKAGGEEYIASVEATLAATKDHGRNRLEKAG